MPNLKLLRDKQVADLLGIGRTTIWRWVNKGILPQPLKIGGISAWRASDIEHVLETAREDSNANGIR